MDAMDANNASDASGAADPDGASDICFAKGCDLPATTTCERCARRFCAAHCGELVLRRRGDPSERPAHEGMLARLPTHTESYMLCAPCRTKPVSRNLSLPPRPGLPLKSSVGGDTGTRSTGGPLRER